MGYPGTESRVQDPIEVQKYIDLLLKHGQVGIDTGRIYGEGTSEKVILLHLLTLYFTDASYCRS